MNLLDKRKKKMGNFFGGPKMLNFLDISNIPPVTTIINGNSRNGAAGNKPVITKPHFNDSQCGVFENNLADMIISLDVTRESFTIPAKLPFCLFSPVNLSEAYRSIFQRAGVTPAGGTVDQAVEISTGDILLTWTVGANSDVIRIHNSGVVPYCVLLEMLKTDYFGGIGFKLTVPSPVGYPQTQFSAFPITWGLSTFGGFGQDGSVQPRVFDSPDQFQLNILNVETSMLINGRRWLVNGFASVAPGVGLPSTLNFDFVLDQYGSSSDYQGSCNR